MNAVLQSSFLKHRFASDWLERVGEALDLSDAQLELAEERYEAVGEWLSRSEHPWLAGSRIFVHGSIGLGTAKKPVGRDEFDVDLVNHLAVPSYVRPYLVKTVVGTRLREHATYRGMLEELPRCWRLNYAGAFHLDITPATSHATELSPALLVPDKRLQCWMPSNPIGFRQLFEMRAALHPRYTLTKDAGIRSKVEQFPMQYGPKGVLRRTVQLLKHNRDLEFQAEAIWDLRPISIIITTLAAQSYERAVLAGVYEADYDLLLAVVEGMPDFIQIFQRAGKTDYVIANETVRGENFAEKWNSESRLPQAFFAWHARVVQAVRELAELEGLDVLAARTSRHFGIGIGEGVLRKFAHQTSAQRESRRLAVAPRVGLAVSAAAATSVRPNTFFGRPE